MYQPRMSSRLFVEALGTFWLVFIGCGSAIFNGKFIAQATTLTESSLVQVGLGHLGVAMAFGFAVTTMAYAVGHVSGAHFNPAVTLGAAVAKRFAWKDVVPYWLAQVVGGLLAGGALAGLVSGNGGIVTGNLAANGFGDHSPGGYVLGSVLVLEALVTAFFVYVILGTTGDDAPVGFAPLAIGLALMLGHFIAIPFSNASLNPARSTAVAFFNGNDAPLQLWAFWVAPLVGAAVAGATFAFLTGEDKRNLDIDGGTSNPANAELDEHGRPVLDR